MTEEEKKRVVRKRHWVTTSTMDSHQMVLSECAMTALSNCLFVGAFRIVEWMTFQTVTPKLNNSQETLAFLQ